MVEALQIKLSSLLLYEIEPDGRVVLNAKSATLAELADSFPARRPEKSVSGGQIKAAAQSGAARRYRKTKP